MSRVSLKILVATSLVCIAVAAPANSGNLHRAPGNGAAAAPHAVLVAATLPASHGAASVYASALPEHSGAALPASAQQGAAAAEERADDAAERGSGLNAWMLVAIGVFLIITISQRRSSSLSE